MLIFLVVISLINLIFIFFVGLFLVNFRDRVEKIFSDFFNLMEEVLLENNSIVPPAEDEFKIKTWDQKFEEELDFHNRRVRVDSGLKNP